MINRETAIFEYSDVMNLVHIKKRTDEMMLLFETPKPEASADEINTLSCQILQVLGVKKENAVNFGFECCYRWEEAAQENKRLQAFK
jgi:hypothetical protein